MEVGLVPVKLGALYIGLLADLNGHLTQTNTGDAKRYNAANLPCMLHQYRDSYCAARTLLRDFFPTITFHKRLKAMRIERTMNLANAPDAGLLHMLLLCVAICSRLSETSKRNSASGGHLAAYCSSRWRSDWSLSCNCLLIDARMIEIRTAKMKRVKYVVWSSHNSAQRRAMMAH
jgi:hypothetical protein